MAKVLSQISRALEVDSRGEKLMAFHIYRCALIDIMTEFECLSTLPVPETQQNLLMLSHNCLERITELSKTISKDFPDNNENYGPNYKGHNKNKNKEEEDDDDEKEEDEDHVGDEMDYLRFASAPASRRQSSNKFPAFNGEHVRSTSLSIPIPQKPPSTKSPSPPTLTLKGSILDLRQLRREHESVLVAKQLERSERILRAQAGALQRNEAYVSGLLEERHTRLMAFNERLEKLLGTLSQRRPLQLFVNWEAQWRRKSLRSSLADIAQRGQDAVMVIEPLVEMFTHPRDPLATVLRDFLTHCRRNIKNIRTTSSDSTITLKTILGEISIVEQHIVDLLAKDATDVEELRDPTVRASIRISLQHYLCSTSLGPSLISLFPRSTTRTDYDSLLEASWEKLFSRLKVRPKLQLPRDRPLDAFPIHEPGIYSKPIAELRAISLHSTPYEKLLCLIRCCNSICQVVDEFLQRAPPTTVAADDNSNNNTGEGRETEEGSAVGGDDLLLLSSYVIVRAAIPDLPVHLDFISKLIPEELIRGEAGYALATMQTSYDYAMSCITTNPLSSSIDTG